MSRLTRDGTAGPVSRDQILRREREQGNGYFPCSADHEQDWQPYPVDPYSCYVCDYTYMHNIFSLEDGLGTVSVVLFPVYSTCYIFFVISCTSECRLFFCTNPMISHDRMYVESERKKTVDNTVQSVD